MKEDSYHRGRSLGTMILNLEILLICAEQWQESGEPCYGLCPPKAHMRPDSQCRRCLGCREGALVSG